MMKTSGQLHPSLVVRFESQSRFQAPVRNLQHPQKPQSGLKGHECSLHLQNQDRELKFGFRVYNIPVTIFQS